MLHRERGTIRSRGYYILVSIFVLLLFYLCILTRNTTDYSTHTNSMANLDIRSLINPISMIEYLIKNGYPLWHITGRIVMGLIKCPAEYAAGISSGIWMILSYIGSLKLLQYFFFHHSKLSEEIESINQTEIYNRRIDIVLPILVFCLFIVAPVWLPWKYEFIIFHVGGINVWHNATNICGRAVGIFAFYYSMKLIDQIVESNYTYYPSVYKCIGLSIIYLLSLLAKPSFAQTFVPAFGILLIYLLIKSKFKFSKHFLLFCVLAILPIIKLCLQTVYYFGTVPGSEGIKTQSAEEGIIFLWPSISLVFDAIKKQLLVLLFPLIMFLISIYENKKIDRYWAISFLMFAIGVFYVLSLKGAAAGEMGWALYIAAFFVFMISIRDYFGLFFSDHIFCTSKHSAMLTISTIALVEQCITGGYYLYELVIKGAKRF